MKDWKDFDRVDRSSSTNYFSEKSDAPPFVPPRLIDADKAKNVKSYDIEFVEDSNKVVDDSETNAIGLKANWYEEKVSAENAKKEEEPKESITPTITLEELEEIRKSAYEDGFAEGKKEGYDQGHKEGYEVGVASGTKDGFIQGQEEGIKNGQNIISREAARFCQYANHLVDPLKSLDEEVSQELIYLASRLARAFIKQELSQNPNVIEGEIAEVCKLLPVASTNISLSLNPKDCQLVKDTLNNLDVKILPDPNLQQGDISANAEVSSVDLRIEERIDKYLAEFLSLNNDKAKLGSNNSKFVANNEFDDVDLNAPLETDISVGNSPTATGATPASPTNNVNANAPIGAATQNVQGDNSITDVPLTANPEQVVIDEANLNEPSVGTQPSTNNGSTESQMTTSPNDNNVVGANKGGISQASAGGISTNNNT